MIIVDIEEFCRVGEKSVTIEKGCHPTNGGNNSFVLQIGLASTWVFGLWVFGFLAKTQKVFSS
jgi:hypothetical protein